MLATYCTLLNGEASIHKESHKESHGALSTKHTWTLHFLSANLLRSNAHAKWKLQGTMRQLEMLHTHTHISDSRILRYSEGDVSVLWPWQCKSVLTAELRDDTTNIYHPPHIEGLLRNSWWCHAPGPRHLATEWAVTCQIIWSLPTENLGCYFLHVEKHIDPRHP